MCDSNPNPTPVSDKKDNAPSPALDELNLQKGALELAELQRKAEVAAEQTEVHLRIQRANAAKAELELAAAEREAARAQASDFENGEYQFCDGVNKDSVTKAIADLNQLSRRHPGKPLTITINSPGGVVIHGLGLYDHIRELSARGHVITVKVRGMAASMGGILLQAGDIRVIGRESRILIHEVSAGTIGRVNDMADDLAFSQELWVHCSKILASRSTMTPKQIRKWAFKVDRWIDAEKAIKLGFADSIG